MGFENYKKYNYMKNLFTVLGLFFAFTFTSFAQEDTASNARILAKAELNALTKVIDLQTEIFTGLNDLLIYKHETVLNFPDKKEEVALTMESKLKSTFSADEFKKIRNNKVLYQDLLY